MVGLLEGDDAGLRVLAARTLADLPDQRALSALTAALRDPDQTLRWRAVEALEASRDPEVVPALLPLLDDPSPQIRAATLAALAALRAPEVLRRLPGACRTSPFPRTIEWWAEQALAVEARPRGADGMQASARVEANADARPAGGGAARIPKGGPRPRR
jgi:hypothetical protein